MLIFRRDSATLLQFHKHRHEKKNRFKNLVSVPQPTRNELFARNFVSRRSPSSGDAPRDRLVVRVRRREIFFLETVSSVFGSSNVEFSRLNTSKSSRSESRSRPDRTWGGRPENDTRDGTGRDSREWRFGKSLVHGCSLYIMWP